MQKVVGMQPSEVDLKPTQHTQNQYAGHLQQPLLKGYPCLYFLLADPNLSALFVSNQRQPRLNDRAFLGMLLMAKMTLIQNLVSLVLATRFDMLRFTNHHTHNNFCYQDTWPTFLQL